MERAKVILIYVLTITLLTIGIAVTRAVWLWGDAGAATTVTIGKAQVLIDSSQAIIDRVDRQVDDEFLLNLKNNINVGATQSQVAINQTTLLTTAAVNLLETIEARSDESLAKLPGVVDRANEVMDRLNQETFPAINSVLNTANQSVGQVEPLLIALHQRLADPELQRLITNLANTAGESAETLESLRATNEEVKEALPELLAQITRLSSNSADVTGETAEFIKGLNKPLTKKQKLIRALIQAAAIAAPVAIRR